MKTFYKHTSNLSAILNNKEKGSTELNETFYNVEDKIEESYAENEENRPPSETFKKRTRSYNYISFNSRKPFDNFIFDCK
jgi:hypothetical protein